MGETKILVDWVSSDGLSENLKRILELYLFRYGKGPFELVGAPDKQAHDNQFTEIKTSEGAVIPVYRNLLRAA